MLCLEYNSIGGTHMNYEKVSVNINDRNLSQIDLLIENDFYTNRSDFINQSIQKKA